MTFKELALQLCECEAGKVEVNIAQMREILHDLCAMMDVEVMECLTKYAMKIQSEKTKKK